jgi:hypothetical protein
MVDDAAIAAGRLADVHVKVHTAPELEPALLVDEDAVLRRRVVSAARQVQLFEQPGLQRPPGQHLCMAVVEHGAMVAQLGGAQALGAGAQRDGDRGAGRLCCGDGDACGRAIRG